MNKILIIIIMSLTLTSLTNAESMHEMNINIGATIPQGTFNKYADNGIYGHVRFKTHLESFKAFSGFADLSGSFFKETDEDVLLSNGTLFLDATERVSEYSVALHIGTILGSDSRNSFFRPKVGIAGGLYLFNTQTLLLDEYLDEEDPLAEDNQTQLRVGWRGIIGTDLFFTPKWGLSFEFTYDHVLNLHHTLDFEPGVGVTKVGQTARFHNYSIGVIFPLPID